MNLLPEQISAAGSRQLEAQLQLLKSATGTAFDGAEKLLALHFDTTRSALEKSTTLLRQVATAKDPRDLFALAKDSQSQLDSMLAYQRKLFGIATAMTSSLVGLQGRATPVANAAMEQLEALPAVAEQTVHVVVERIEEAVEPVAPVLAAAPAAPLAEPETPPPAEPIAELTPVAQAAQHAQPHPSSAPFTVDADSTPIEVNVQAADPLPPAAKAAGRPKKK
jgi:phasin family protein